MRGDSAHVKWEVSSAAGSLGSNADKTCRDHIYLFITNYYFLKGNVSLHSRVVSVLLRHYLFCTDNMNY